MRHNRVYNFSSGPAMLPEPVLEQVRDELLNYRGSGTSILEMSHRSKCFDEVLAHAEAKTRELLGVGEDYAILFLQGGASFQFAMVPLNLTQAGKPVDVVHTGYWTEMAIGQLKKGFEFRVAASGEKEKFRKLPSLHRDQFNPGASYACLCSNNTIEGTQWKEFPDTGAVPLVADMSSDFLSRPIDARRFGLIFAGAQKNLGPSGTVVVALRKELAERCDEKVPTMLQYRAHIKAGSRYNTPGTFGIYVSGLVMDWISREGGLAVMERRNQEKARVLYSAIDGSGFYKCPIDKDSRSVMNVVFRIRPESPDSEKIEDMFVKEAAKAGFTDLKGHRSAGGLRASIYNAFPLEGVKALVDFMGQFERKSG